MKKVFINIVCTYDIISEQYLETVPFYFPVLLVLMLFESHAKGKGTDGSAVPANQYPDINHIK